MRNPLPRAKTCAAILILVAVALPGCRTATGTVRGTVTGYNPKIRKVQPVMAGRIRFYCEERVVSADIFEGQFEVAELPIGEVRITVESPETQLPPAGKNAPPWFSIPEKYRQIDTTPLQWTVVPGIQEVEVNLMQGNVTEKPATNP